MGGWVIGWVDGWVGDWMGDWVVGWVGDWVGGWIFDGWMDGWICDGWMDGWVGGGQKCSSVVVRSFKQSLACNPTMQSQYLNFPFLGFCSIQMALVSFFLSKGQCLPCASSIFGWLLPVVWSEVSLS